MFPSRVTMIICGSVAAYKSLELVREIRRTHPHTELNVVLTRAAAEFITPLSVSALTGRKTYTELFSLTDEVEMGHIALARQAECILVVPASADFIAKAAHGIADDIATTLLLARDRQHTSLIIAPAMNPSMWAHPATQRNITQLQRDGAVIISPDAGEAACGEVGVGRLARLDRIMAACLQPRPTHTFDVSLTLQGKHFIVTAGATHEPLDPVRFIGNYSSGKQGIAIAQALLAAGAEVTLIYGMISAPLPTNIRHIHATTAEKMLNAVQAHLPADGIICAAAVADWQLATPHPQKLKKQGAENLTLEFSQTPDILDVIAHHPTMRPALVIGFAAETHDMLEHARAKLTRKGVDWMLANNVAGGAIFGEDDTDLTLLTATETIAFGRVNKYVAAEQLIIHIMEFFHHAS